jgi:hypothetical protein
MIKGTQQNYQLLRCLGRRSTFISVVDPSRACWLVAIFCWVAGSYGQPQSQPTSYDYDLAGNLTFINTADLSAPSIVSQPQSQLLPTNGPISLSVVASGLGVTYQWLSNGIPIAGATNDTLLFANLASSYFANYTVVLSNASGIVTSTVANIWSDSNANGLPDWWEVKYFGNLDQSPDDDFDGDGVSNMDEYLEGTKPADPTSYNPRLHIQTANGRVVASPAQPYYKMGQLVELTAIPDLGQEFLGWSGAATGVKSNIWIVMNSHKTVIASFGLSLPVALDNTNLVWTTGGDAPWFGQTQVSEDGLGSAQSGYIGGGQQSWLQTTTSQSQPMQLGFWWLASSQPPDGLAFSVDGVLWLTNAGVPASWQLVQTNLTAGNHLLQWTYSKQTYDLPTGLPFADSGWVDEVTFSPVPHIAEQLPPLLSIALTSPTPLCFPGPPPRPALCCSNAMPWARAIGKLWPPRRN